MRVLISIVTLVLIPFIALSAQSQPAALKIVVLEGEGGVNIIQQKTAVRPLVEVRDRNNVPVAGATVTFTIGGGGQSAAFAGGVQTLTVTTNAAGQAAASGLNALSSGAFQIQVQAAYQGQIATAAISQTNFATAAAASQASAGAGAGAGGGGGISGTTLGIVDAAVGGGALAATQVAGDKPNEDEFDSYNGPVNGQITLNSVFTPSIGPDSFCTFVRTITGSMSILIKHDGSGSGSSSAQLTITEISASSGCSLDPAPHGFTWKLENTPVTGAPSAITFTSTQPGALLVDVVRFNGALSGNTITGTLTMEQTPAAGANPRYNGSTTMSVTLSR
jgi:hypothetical protein